MNFVEKNINYTLEKIVLLIFSDLLLYVIPARQLNSEARNMTSWLRNETLSAVDYDTYSNYSGIVLARSSGGLTITITGE